MHFRPVTWARPDVERALRQTNPLFHAEESEPPTACFLPLKSFPIIEDTDPDSFGSPKQSHHNHRGFRMLQHILKGFLRHAIEAGGHLDGNRFRHVSRDVLNGKRRALCKLVGMILNRRFEA